MHKLKSFNIDKKYVYLIYNIKLNYCDTKNILETNVNHINHYATTNYNKNNNRKLFVSKNNIGGLFNYTDKFNDS